MLVAAELVRRLAGNESVKERVRRAIPWIRHWLNRPIIVPHQRPCWWHMGRTSDQKPAMQIVGYWYVTNHTDSPVSILNAHIASPPVQGHVMVKDTQSDYHGSYPVPPHATTDLHANFWIEPPTVKKGKDLVVDVVFIDSFGQKRTLRKVTFKSDEKRKEQVFSPREETVYDLTHDVEKEVAGVLKDEINRYRKSGRQHGHLGSLHAVRGDQKILSIYQDSWSTSAAGERQEIVSRPDEYRLHSENGDALVTRYKKLTQSDEKAVFVDALLSRLDRSKEYYCVSYLIVYVLLRIGRLKEALAAAHTGLIRQKSLLDLLLNRKPREERREQHQRYGFSDMLGMINGFLRYEHGSLTDADLDQVEKFIYGLEEHTFRIGEKISSIRAFRLSSSLAK